MSNEKVKTIHNNSGLGGLWFIGFIGTLIYFIQYHSGTFGLVLLAIIKAIFWPGFLIYYLFKFMGV